MQQSVADLGVAFKNFFDSCKGKRKGRNVKSPRFKKRSNKQSARLTRRGFSIQGDGVYLAKIGVVKPIWSRALPLTKGHATRTDPSSVTIIKDCSNSYFLSFVVDIEPVKVHAKNQSIGIDLGIKTFALIE
ncbi:transposase [Moorena sp. SIO4G3]|uniref:RNA-guided endonuclease InsQ/TnpB family protein n=1 Tax=Moorena sp. SIO4G3 TaxID=2607821 RepID=UPI0034194158